jgi:hypothetical protein
MDLKDKIINVLSQALQPEQVRLDDDDGISGFVVSRVFEGMSTLDRQGKIEELLQNAELTHEQRRRILLIAGLTPEEYEAVGARIRVHRVKEKARGVVEILLHGGRSDAEYVRGVLNNRKGVQTYDPRAVSGAIGVLMSFLAKGSEADPLTKEKAIQALKKDRYIEVVENA